MANTHKKISDPVHGVIELGEIEQRIVATRAFQRLHNIRQLGLAHYIFPAANYSRFAHSVGAYCNASRMLAAINRTSPESNQIGDREQQLVKIAALTHDIGHYPFSHAFEHEIKEASSDYYLSGDLEVGATLDHEEMGEKLLSLDPEIAKILASYGIGAEEVSNQFRKDRSKLARILSSDLDCGRLDYLRRTAHHSGLPYGNVDINYLVDHARIDQKGAFCFSHKALRAADHLLVSRYFDYLQVPFHKGVVALEWSLRVVIRELIRCGSIDCSASHMSTKVETGDWYEFDDNKILGLARDHLATLQRHRDPDLRSNGLIRHIHAILHRRPAKLIASRELVGASSGAPVGAMAVQVKDICDQFRETHGLCDLSIHVWRPKPFALIKASTRTPIPIESLHPEEGPEVEEFVHILKPDKTSRPIFDFESSLMHSIYAFQYQALRVFAMPSENPRFKQIQRTDLLPKLKEVGMYIHSPSEV